MGSQRASQRKVLTSPPGEVDELASSSEEEQEWEARAILDEKTIPNPDYKKSRSNSHSSRSKRTVPRTITQYLIDWEGFNPGTGERWEPSWEDGEGATQGLIDEWERRKETDPELVGRYTRNAEEKKRRSAAKEKFQRKEVTGQSVTPKKPSAARAPSGIAAKAGRSAITAITEAEAPLPAGEERNSNSPSTSKSVTSERRKRRNIVTSPIASEEDVEMEQNTSDRQSEASGQRHAYGITEKTEATRMSKRDKRAKETSEGTPTAPAPTSVEKKKQASTVSPASAPSATSRKRKRSSPSRNRPIAFDSEEDLGPATIMARTTVSDNQSTVRLVEGRKSKKRKLLEKGGEASSKKDDSSVKAVGARDDKASKLVGDKVDVLSNLKSSEGRKKSRNANAADAPVEAETPSSRRNSKHVSGRPLHSQLAKGPANASSEVDRSPIAHSPSVVGDSQPPLTSSGESRESQKTPPQRTPSDLGRSDSVRRLAIAGAMNQASPGSPKRKQISPPLLVNTEAGSSRTTAAPAPVPAQDQMAVNRDFVPNSLFALDDGYEDGSPDLPQSQAQALQRAIDLLMAEEHFLEQEQAALSQPYAPAPADEVPPVVPEAEPSVPQQPAVSSNVSDANASRESVGKPKEPTKRATRELFAAVDDFSAPAQSETPAPSVPAQTATNATTSKPLHPLPQIAPSVFRNAGISGTPRSSENTQPDSIHDFDSPHRNTGGQEATAAPAIAASVQFCEQAVAANAAIETEVIIEQIIAQMPDAADARGHADEEEDPQLPDLGEDVWSRVSLMKTVCLLFPN